MWRLRDPATPLLRTLADVTHESVYLTVLDGCYALYIYAVESPTRLEARTTVGDRAHLHCTSVGKAMLAFLPTEQAWEIVQRVGLSGFTPNTITAWPGLMDELAAIRRRGYAIDRAEHELDTYCIGAPIFNAHSRVLGACSLSGVDPAIVDSRLAELAGRVQFTAQQISRLMGYVPQRPAQLATRTTAPIHHPSTAGEALP